MLSLKLWRALHHPPAEHPLFWRMLRRSPIALHPLQKMGGWSWLDRLSILYLVIFAASVLTNMINAAAQSTFLGVLLFLLILPVAVPVLILLRSTLFSGQIYGLLWADEVSQALVDERINRTADLLAVLPGGELAAGWVICTACAYRGDRFNQVLDLHTVMTRIIAILAALAVLSNLLAADQRVPLTHILWLCFGAVIILAFLKIDFAYSVLISLLVAMLLPHYTRTRLDARLATAGIVLFFQMFTYACAALAGPMLLPRLYYSAGLKGSVADASIWLLSLLIFCLIREAIIQTLWRWLRRRTNTTAGDLDALFGFTRRSAPPIQEVQRSRSSL